MSSCTITNNAWAITLLVALGSVLGNVVDARNTNPGPGLSPSARVRQPPPWAGLVGVDYNPNHYPAGAAFNNHDVFYVGSIGNARPITNVYAELAQLKAAGFTTVRSYQTVEYSWIDIIRRANALGMYVVYEAAIPQSGNQTDITNAVSVLNNVIGAVGAPMFQNVVTLVFAGHENYSNTNIDYLTGAIRQLKAALAAASLQKVPVGMALVSGNLVTPGSPADMQTLINNSSKTAPLGFDPYPFQWGVAPPGQAATKASLLNSIAWDYVQVKGQPFYPASRPILMAETGWATAGSGQFADYFCFQQNNCKPGVANAANYLQALYGFVRVAGNNAGALIFEAYDEPAKDPVNPTDAENFYGLFTTNCKLKNGNTALLPNTAFVPGKSPGCQGFTSGVAIAVVGTQPGNPQNQPPFTVAIQQTNPVTTLDASLSVTVPNRNRTHMNLYPWPQYLVYDSAKLTITGVTSGASCHVTARVTGQKVSWGTVSCSKPAYQMACSGPVCYLPGNNF